MLDSNEDIQHVGPFHRFVASNQLVDAIGVNNPQHAETRPTYNRSQNRIDYILISRDLLPSITRSGHYDFHELFQKSDHRGIYMSLNTAHIFDAAEFDPTRIENRQLQLHKREVVEKYLRILTKLFEDNKFWERMVELIQQLQNNPNNTEKERLVKKFDTMDREKTQYMLRAEKKSGLTVRTGIYEWSPFLEKSGRTYTYWKARYHLRRLKLPIPPSLQLIQQNLNITSTSNSLQYIRYKYQLAKKELKKIQKEAKKHREKHLHQLAEYYATTRQSSKATELKQIIRNERIRSIARKHRWYFKRNNFGMVPYLLIPNTDASSDDKYKIIYDPGEIHQHLL